MRCSKQFLRFKNEGLKEFLATVPRERYDDIGSDHSASPLCFFTFRDSDWFYEKTHSKNSPFLGMVKVEYHDELCWGFAFKGDVIDPGHVDDIEFCLKQALTVINPYLPVRGPRMHVSSNGYRYFNDISGDLCNFSGTERVEDKDGKCIYKMSYNGGCINLWLISA